MDAAAVGVVLAGLAVGVLAVGFVAWRWARRRWVAVRRHPLALTAGAVVAGLRGTGAPLPEAAEVHRWTSPQARRRLWQAVTSAEEALAVAEAAGAPVAGLPGVCRRLHAAAEDLDRVLRVEARPVPAVRDRVGELLATADAVREAALTASGEVGSAGLEALARDARQELACLVAGLRATRSST